MKYTDKLLEKIAKNEFIKSNLDLSNQNLIDEALPELVSAIKTNKYIKALNLNENLLTDEGVKQLGELGLSSLKLTQNRIRDVGIAALANAKYEELELDNCGLRDAYLQHFNNNTTLKKLDISNNGLITAAGLQCLVSTKIKVLVAGSLRGSDKLAQAISGTETSFVEINLMQNSIGNEGAKALAVNKNLRKLSLFYNEVGFEGAEALSHHQGLIELNLSRNCLNDAAAKLLGNISTLKVLDISFNEDIKNIEDVLSTLKTLNPSLNVIANGYEACIKNHDRQPNKRVKRKELPTFFPAASSQTFSVSKNNTVWTGVIPSTILGHSVTTN